MTGVPSSVSVETLIWLSSVVLAMLVATIVLTMGRSVLSARYRAQVDQKRSPVRRDVFRHIRSDSVEPGAWIAGLTTVERTALRAVVEEILRHFRGGNQARVRRIARELGLEAQAHREFETGKRHKQLHALSWFWLLESRVDPDRLIELSRGDSDTEAAATRVLLAGDYERTTERAIDLLLARGQSLSVMGMEALYNIQNDDPTSLFRYIAGGTTDCSRSLLIQLLEVISHAEPVGSAVSLDWIIASTTHESADVRVAAFDALSDYGWRDDVRAGVDWERALADESSEVRQVVYRLLGSWDDWASSVAIASLPDDPDDRARVAGIESLFGHVDPDDLAASAEIQQAIDWVARKKAVG